MDVPVLLFRTVVLRPYVFLFLAVFLFAAQRLIGWRRTGFFFLITWLTAFACEFSSTRTGIPFGWYHYTGSTVGQELYLSNVPFMDSLSFIFLLYASYCLALFFLLPVHDVSIVERSASARINLMALVLDSKVRVSVSVLGLSVLFFVFIDMVIDPLALRGEQWFLGKIYYYPDPGIHFGVPVANYIGWAVVGLIALSSYFILDRRLQSMSPESLANRPVTGDILLGCGLYYGVLLFNLAVTFWIGEALLGMTGVLIYLPITALALLRLLNRFPGIGSPRHPEGAYPKRTS
ncbi:MAG TPA: carotenoid biosynthesis protein [Nitrospiraceae bacterium]|nr:carotenoid biosynthesis protein [Nitrospiraceae bacterium]